MKSGNPLKSTVTNTFRNQSYEAVKITHAFTMGKWFDHSCFYLTPIYGQPIWLLSSIMYRAYLFTLIDLINRGFDFVWLSRKFK